MNRRDSDSALQSALASTVRLLCKDVEEFARAGGAQQSSAALADRVLHRARRLETIEPRFHSLPLVALIRKRLAKQQQVAASSTNAALPSAASFSLAAVATGNQPPLELSEQLRAELEHAVVALTASLSEAASAAGAALEASTQSRQQQQQSYPRASAVDGVDALLVSRPRQNQRRISDFSVEEEAEDRDLLEDSMQSDSFDGGDDAGFGGRRHRGSGSDGIAETGDDGDSEDFETIDDGDEDDADSYDEENLAVDLQRASTVSASAASVRIPSSVSKTQSAAAASSTSSHSWLFRDRRRGSGNDGRAGGGRNANASGASGSGGGGRGAGRNHSGGGRLHSSSMRSLHSSLSVATPNAGGASQVLFSDDDDDADGDGVARTKRVVGCSLVLLCACRNDVECCVLNLYCLH
jgi:hypothetical protein